MLSTVRNDAVLRGQLLERYRSRLYRKAKQALDPHVRGRVGASDIVQNTMLDAERGLAQFAGATIEEFEAWLLTTHRRATLREILKHKAGKRHVARERRLTDQGPADSCVSIDPVASVPTPSVFVMRREQTAQLMKALNELPRAQQAAVTLHYLQGRSVPEIADILGRTRSATEGLLKRGLATLRTVRQQLSERGNLDR